MRQLLFFLITVLCLGASGCSSRCVAIRTNIAEPLQFCGCRQERLESRHNRRSAEYVWQCVQENRSGEPFSPDYEQGFKEGFTDFMELGGTGAPPPIPPRRYWKLKYRTPRGHRAVQDWYAGFRDGAAEARDGCYRRWREVPSSMSAPLSMYHESPID